MLENKVFKRSFRVNAPYEYSFVTEVMDFKENGKKIVYKFKGADDLPYNGTDCWKCYFDESPIKIDRPNYIEYVWGENITLVEGKLHYKSQPSNGYSVRDTLSTSSLREIEDFKEDVQQVKCDGFEGSCQ